MIALLLALAAPQTAPMTAVDAERAFAADAQTLGQWTAFRKWASADSIMFLPQPSSAQAFLKPLADPSRAVEWKPAESYVSCDGTVAANTGPTRWPNGRIGYFSTVWHQTAGAWRWTVDHGDFTPALKWDWATEPKIVRASCERKPRAIISFRPKKTVQSANGQSKDHTLFWQWTVEPDGARRFFVLMWNGERYERVIFDEIAAPKPTAATP